MALICYIDMKPFLYVCGIGSIMLRYQCDIVVIMLGKVRCCETLNPHTQPPYHLQGGLIGIRQTDIVRVVSSHAKENW